MLAMLAQPRPPLHTTTTRSVVRSTSEFEFERLTLSRDFSKNFVTRMLTDLAERGGWELDRVRILEDGTRRIVLRRKIIRQPRPA